MGIPERLSDALQEKLRRLSAEDLAEVERFVDLLRQGLVDDYTRMSEEAFARIWDNPADAEYDRL